MLGITFEIPNLMSKNLKDGFFIIKEKKLFDAKREAISKMEHVY